MISALKLIPLLLAWSGIAAAVARHFSGRRVVLMIICASSFAGGVIGGNLLIVNFKGDIAYNTVKSLSGASFLFLWVVALAAFYRVTGSGRQNIPLEQKKTFKSISSGTAILAGLLAGAICVCRLAPQGGALPFPLFVLGVAGALLAVSAISLERFLPENITMTGEALLALVVSLLLFASSFSLQLDLFSPLSMKVMKFIHDFVHQFFESMLVPDHLFFRRDAWEYIGYLFSSGVGFWGGLLIWLAPVILICAAIRLERLPPVSHIRQGAQRRKLLAAFIRERRCRLIVPGLAMLVLGGAVYNSCFPGVEYWDPKPVAVTMNQSGEIVIPKKGEIDLEDGKLHKFLFKQGGREARFMILQTPDGQLTVTLDACAICKPEGYGQAEGAVLCYYCKTLIPLDTVGKPGGCNPVPVPFKAGPDSVTVDAMTIINRWSETVTATSKGGGK
jgi:FtrD-like iron-sulfur protein